MRTLDASRWQAFRLAELPAALPAALSGARVALAVGVIGAFIAEVATPTTGAYPGLGRQIMTDVNLAGRARLRRHRVLVAFALPASTRSRWPSASSRHGGADRQEPRRDPQPAAPAAAALDRGRPARRRRAALARSRRSRRALALSACGSKQDTLSAALDQALHRDARLLPERRPRGAVLGDRPRRLPRGRPRRRPVTPADPSEPLKLLAAGRVDMAISYEPELLLARDSGLNVVSIGALVQRPLTSIIALPSKHVSGRRLARPQAGRHRRHPLPGGRAAHGARTRAREAVLGARSQRRLQPRPGDDLRAASTRRSAASGTTRASSCA